MNKCKWKNPIITCTWKKRNRKVDLGKCGQMYRAPFLYLPGTPIHKIHPYCRGASSTLGDWVPLQGTILIVVM